LGNEEERRAEGGRRAGERSLVSMRMEALALQTHG
jgi:hypothetical protein